MDCLHTKLIDWYFLVYFFFERSVLHGQFQAVALVEIVECLDIAPSNQQYPY